MSATSELDERVDRLYATYTGHLYRCPPCQQENHCATGNRMRVAWKTAQAAAIQAYRARKGRPRRCAT